MNCEKVFEHLINATEKYVVDNDLESVVLGISGGIDSTVCAAICHEVSMRTNITFYGRSLTIKNHTMYEDEFDTSNMVGNAFCDDFRTVNLVGTYETLLGDIVANEEGLPVRGYQYDEIEAKSHEQTPIANGNIQARLRMNYLYNLAGIHRGIVIDTDNLSEHYLGFYTIHGDQGDFNPIGGLWKTEVYELARYIAYRYKNMSETLVDEDITLSHTYEKMYNAMFASIKLTPTDGLGISSSDLEQIGAESYAQVDDILQTLVYFTDSVNYGNNLNMLYSRYTKEVVDNVLSRYVKSSFKRKKLPVVVETKNCLGLCTMESSIAF